MNRNRETTLERPGKALWEGEKPCMGGGSKSGQVLRHGSTWPWETAVMPVLRTWWGREGVSGLKVRTIGRGQIQLGLSIFFSVWWKPRREEFDCYSSCVCACYMCVFSRQSTQLWYPLPGETIRSCSRLCHTRLPSTSDADRKPKSLFVLLTKWL